MSRAPGTPATCVSSRSTRSLKATPGFTYFVTIDEGDGPRRFVLRLPPPGARIAGPADVVRQGRIMAALHAAGLPVPAIPVLTSDPVVDGRPFVLMEAVDGERIEKTGVEQKPLEIAALRGRGV